MNRNSLLLVGFMAWSLAACRDGNEDSKDRIGQEVADERDDVVVLDTTAIRIGGIVVGTPDTVRSTSLRVTGTISYDANRVSHVGARTEGRVIEIGVDLGTQVRTGQVLAELESPLVGQIRAEAREAEALVRIARENFERERRLEAQGISSRKEYLAAEADLRRAEAAQESASDRLTVLGAGHGNGGHFDIVAPRAGVVVARRMSLGGMAAPGDTLLTIADLSSVWIELDVFERDLARVSTGQAVQVTTTAWADRRFPGRIVYLGEILDPTRRTALARVQIPNTNGALKPGMFATASIQVETQGPPLLVVPQAAVEELEGRRVVFVPGDRAGEFKALPVEVGEPIDESRVAIRGAVTPVTRLVVAGAFALRSELARREIRDGGH